MPSPTTSPPQMPLRPRQTAGLTRAFLRLKHAARKRPRIRLQTLVHVLGRDGLLALNALLALLNIVLSPLQGVSLPLGFIQIMITLALLRGRTTFWMPRRWQVYRLSGARIARLLDRWLPTVYGLERVSHPRLGFWMKHHTVKRATLWLLFFLAVIVALPIPFINLTPSLAAFLLCLALINADGAMWLIGLLVVVAHGGLFVFWHAFYPHLLALYHHYV